MSLQAGDTVLVTGDGPFGAFDPKCWTVEEGRLTDRLYFDPVVTVGKGDKGYVLDANDSPDEGWFVVGFGVDFGEHVVALHESWLEKVG